MVEIAKGYKTITRVDDGYSIVATPSTILVPTNYDGTNPVLSGAKARVLVTNALGASLTVTITSITPTGCTATYSGNELTITGISSDNANVLVYFSATGGYIGNINIPVLKSKQGESAYSVVLTNETHALPADYNGTVSPSAIDMAQSQIIVLKGATPLTPVAANATPTIGQFRYNIGTVTGGTATRVNNSTFKLSTITASTCKIKVTIYLESLSKSVEKEMVITKVAEGSPGPQAPLVLDRGEFDPTATYVGTSQRVDVVLYSGTPYITKPTAGTFSGIPPTNTSKWDTFGAQFESVYTKVLNAVTGNINTLGSRYVNVLDTLNVPRTVIGGTSTHPSIIDPTTSSVYSKEGIRQYFPSGNVMFYQGWVTGLSYEVGGVPKTFTGFAQVVFKETGEIFSVFDGLSVGAQVQYVSSTPTTWDRIRSARLVSTRSVSADPNDLISDVTSIGAEGLILNNTHFCGDYDGTTTTIGIKDPVAEVWLMSTASGAKYVNSNNGTQGIVDGWYTNISGVGFNFDIVEKNSFRSKVNVSLTLTYMEDGIAIWTESLLLENIIVSASSPIGVCPPYSINVSKT